MQSTSLITLGKSETRACTARTRDPRGPAARGTSGGKGEGDLGTVEIEIL